MGFASGATLKLVREKFRVLTIKSVHEPVTVKFIFPRLETLRYFMTEDLVKFHQKSTSVRKIQWQSIKLAEHGNPGTRTVVDSQGPHLAWSRRINAR